MKYYYLLLSINFYEGIFLYRNLLLDFFPGKIKIELIKYDGHFLVFNMVDWYK